MATELVPRERRLRLGASELCPRERLLRHGAGSLLDEEILAVLLRTRWHGETPLELAHDLLQEIVGLVGLRSVHGNLSRQPGIDTAKASSLLAAVGLGCRLARAEIQEREILGKPALVARYLSLRYANQDQESLAALLLKVRQQVIAEDEIFRGTLCRAFVEPRAILKKALLVSAASPILFHTHPAGEPSSSPEDVDSPGGCSRPPGCSTSVLRTT